MRNKKFKPVKSHVTNVIQTKVNESLEKAIKKTDNENHRKINNNLEIYYINLGKLRL